ncbi:hypothetical protein KW782_03240 [Candidatus Parcubacteria bacterium]|nr:hypothetical protein [Candidatus Parcubacteria bacterium]
MTLQEINKNNIDEMKDLVFDKEAFDLIQSEKEPAFIIVDNMDSQPIDELVDIEITLRKGRRVGLFSE